MEGQMTATLVNSARGCIPDHLAKNDVFALDYMKFGRLTMDFTGQYPYKEFGINTRGAQILGYYRWIVITVSLLCEILCVMYTWNRRHELDFFHLGHHYGCIITTAVLLQRLTLPFQKSFYSLLHKFITEYHLLHLEHESDFAKEENIRIGKFCRIISVIMGLQLFIGVFTYNLMPVYHNWSNGWFSGNPPQNKTLEHSVFLELPFDYTHEVGLAYYSVVMFTFYPCFNVSSGLCAYDFLISIMVFHIWGHFNILAYKLRTFPALSSQQYDVSQDYTKRTFQLLKNIMKHYQFIKRFMSDVSGAFETTLCFYLSYHQLHGCVLLLEISTLTPEAIGKYFMLTVFLFQQLVMICMIFEQINSKSEKLPAQVYNIPWEGLDVNNRRIVLCLLSDVQNTLSVKALGVLPVGVMTMSAIIRTTISYFLLFHTLSSVPKDVFAYGYMRAVRFSLSTLAQWPNTAASDPTKRSIVTTAYHFVMYGVMVALQAFSLSYVWKNIKKMEFVVLGQAYVNVLTTFLFLQRSTLSFQKRYSALVKRFVSEFHLMHHEHKSEYAAKEHLWITKLCHTISIIFHIQLVIGILGYNLIPLYGNYKNGMFSQNGPANATLEHSIYYDLPFDYITNFTGYIIIFLINWYPSYNVASGICIMDLLIFVMVLHVMGHINILMHNLNHFPRPSIEFYDVDLKSIQSWKRSYKEYNEEVTDFLKDIIKHHQLIKEFLSDISSAFDMSLCVYLGFHQLAGCVLLLECSAMTLEALGKYGILTAVLFQQLVQISLLFEQISSKGDKLIDDVYGLPWELMDNKNRKLVCMLLRYVQNPLSVKACGMVPVDVRTMFAIVKASCMYFLALNTFTKK